MGKNILDNVLTIDADSFFIRKTKFFEKGIPLYNIEIGYHKPYFDILEKVLGYGKEHPKYTGTTHYMLFQRKYMGEILALNAKRNKEDFWLEVMKNIDLTTESGFSEFELYFNYMLKYHPEKIKLKKFNFADFPTYNPFFLKIFKLLGYTYVSCHHYYDKQKFAAVKSFIRVLLTRIGIKNHLKNLLMRLGIFKRK